MSENITKDDTNNSLTNDHQKTIINDINELENNNISIISKSFENKIPEFLSFLLDNKNLATNKIKIVRFLQNLFIKNEMNSEIISRICIFHNIQLNIYKIIIHEYLIYKNDSNQAEDEISYRRELLVLFDILLTQLTFDRESYHYILSFLIHSLNVKNGNMDSSQEFNSNSELLNRILILLQKYYHPFDISKFYGNYFFFNGESESSVTIQNKQISKENKKIINLDDKIYFLFFIKTLQTEQIKTENDKTSYNIIKIKLNEKNKESEILLVIDNDNNLNINVSNCPIGKLLEKETNCLLIKLKKKKKLEVKLYVNGKKLYEDKNIEKEKPEIKEIILFENFVGQCYSFMIFKNKCPKFIKNELKLNENTNMQKKSFIYSNRFNNEESIIPLLKMDLKDDTGQLLQKKTLKNINEKNFFEINCNDYKEFMDKIIAIYIPSRITIPKTYEKNNLLNTPQLIIEDSINELNAEFNTKTPILNGVHIYKKIKNDLNQVGGLNNLLPIMELMVNNSELLTKENIESYFDIILSIFSSYYKDALINEAKNNFFIYLSYFMEKIPSNFYDNNMTNIFKNISSFFADNICEGNYILNHQYQNYILMNEQILFKFHYKEQNEIIKSMSHFIQKLKPERKKGLSIDIFKIIKILLHLDEKKNKLFCCKKHSDFFIENKGIMEPELNVRLSPMKELLKHLFNKEYKKFVIENKNVADETGKSLFRIVTMLASDISPCLQKMIIELLLECLEVNFGMYIENFDQDYEFLDISLFVYKNSIFDVKEVALKLIFLLLKNNRFDCSCSQDETFQFITNNILPYFLFQDEEIINAVCNSKNEQNNEEQNEIIDENIEQEKSGKDNANLGNVEDDVGNLKINTEKSQDIDMSTEKGESALFDEMYGDTDNNDSENKIKAQMIINKVKYSLPLFDDNLKKIYSLYNKNKLKLLINNLFEIVLQYFSKGILIKLCINLLIKLSSKGDILKILVFLEALSKEAFKNTKDANLNVEEELKNNQNLLQWLIETFFHAKLLKGNNFDEKKFTPGFDLNVTKIENGEEIKITGDDIVKIINQIIVICQKLLSKILPQNIYKLDYIFTWGKFYYELKNETNNFKSVRELILSFMPEIAYEYMRDMAKLDKLDFDITRMSIYFFNLLFEFVTYYKLKQEDLESYLDESCLYQELSQNLKYILVSKMDDSRTSLKPIDVQEKLETKFEEYYIIKSIYANWTPLWNDEKKIERQKNDIYSQYIKNKKNIDIKELEIMFYDFSDLEMFKDEKIKHLYVNKGIPLVFILYHFFTLILSIGGFEEELKQIFYDFRLFIILLIISSSTLTSQGTGKKKKWPTEEQYKDIQNKIESILFNVINFFIVKIKNSDEKINQYNELPKEVDSNEEKYLDYLKKIKALIVINVGYILKILNSIYKEKKKEQINNKGFSGFFKSIFTDSDETTKSGGYKLMDRLYSESPNLSNTSGNENPLDKITELKFDVFFATKKPNEEQKNKIYVKLEENISKLIEDTEFLNFFEKHEEENKKVLFPFISYINGRLDAVKTIIPIYDIRPNISTYPKNFYFVPDYIPENTYDSLLITSINPVHTQLTKNINLDTKACQLEHQYKSHNYKKEKERLFSFRGIWSTTEFFYNKEKYRLKYRLVNHLSQDYTRVLLTPIIDVDYYLPQFSKFNENDLFRSLTPYKQIKKVTDLSFDIKKLPPEKDPPKKGAKKTQTPTPTPTPTPTNEISTSTFLIQEKESEEKTEKIESPKENNEEKDSDKNALFYIGEEIFNSMKEEKKKDIHNYLFVEYIHKKHTIIESDCYQTDACFVKVGFHIRGFIFNNSKGIGFYSFESMKIDNDEEEEFDEDRKVCFGSVFRSQNHKYNNFYIWIPFSKIQMIFKRRYFFKRQAIEIFTEDRKSYFFKLKEKNIQYFFDNMRDFIKQDIEDIYIAYNRFDEKIGFFFKNNLLLNFNMNFISSEKKSLNLKSIYDKWSKWEMSTLRLLMILNIYGNRSYNNVDQYHVFPWIITDYVSEAIPSLDTKNFIRPMYKPMGMLDFNEESKERKETYEMNWQESENDPDRDENYDRYGSHYSTSLYLTYYLVRVFPYSYLRIELQGKKFDDPNRLFNLLSNSFENATTQKSDVRELIPEFFCFPEMFLNMNELNLGQIVDSKGNAKLVQNVEMPSWSKNNSYIFIEKHRELLESPEVSEKINEWFNIIFGSKQKGKEAKKIKNLFVNQSYEDFEETYKKLSKMDKIYKCRMVEFGVTPNQIFKNHTFKRQNLNDNNKIKRSLLFNILQKTRKKQKITGKELELEENKINTKENIQKFLVFLVTRKDLKKERIFFITKNKLEIFKKYRPQIFKSAQFDRSNSKKIKTDKDKEKEETDEDYNLGDILVESQVLEEDDKITETEKALNNSNNSHEKDLENNLKNKAIKSLIYKYDRKYKIPKYRMNFDDSPMVLYNEGNIVVLGGFWNGDIIMQLLDENQKNKSKKMNIIKTNELYPITKIIIDKTETFVICANSEGAIFIYIIDQKDKMTWNFKKKINEGQGEVSSMEINENLGIFVICFKNGYCMVYTLPNCKIINSFLIESKELDNNINENNKDNKSDIIEETPKDNNSNIIYAPSIVFISSTPLPCFIFYIKERKSLCVYSINAHLLNEYKLGYEIVNNGILKYTDFTFMDFLFIYNPINYTIDIHKLTDLNIVTSSPMIEYQFIDFHFSVEFDSLYILIKDKNTDYKMLALKQAKIINP